MKINKIEELPESFKDKKVCIMGLGYVGLTLAVTLAEIGFDVLGIEINEEILKKLNKGIPHFFEGGLDGRLKSVINSKKLRVLKKIPKVCESSVFIITVGTPIDKKNRVNKKMITNVCNEISEHLKENNLVILRSTVEVGTTKRLEKEILKKRKINFDIAFCPERTIEGKAMIELRKLPQIIGTNNMTTSSRLSQFFSFLTPTVVRVSSYETAELIKLVDNCQRDVNFALSNEIAEISDKLDVSAFEVIDAGKLGYPRTNLPLPGPVGGPCLEKDSYILESTLKKKKYFPKIIMNSRLVNKNQPKESVKSLKKLSTVILGKKNPLITIAGMAFKGIPETNDLRGAMSKPIFEEVLKNFRNSQIQIFDKIVNEDAIRTFLNCKNFFFTSSLQKAFKNTSIFIICNNHPLFSSMPITNLAKMMVGPGIIFDYWNNFSNQKIILPKGIHYVGLGGLGKKLESLKR